MFSYSLPFYAFDLIPYLETFKHELITIKITITILADRYLR